MMIRIIAAYLAVVITFDESLGGSKKKYAGYIFMGFASGMISSTFGMFVWNCALSHLVVCVWAREEVRRKYNLIVSSLEDDFDEDDEDNYGDDDLPRPLDSPLGGSFLTNLVISLLLTPDSEFLILAYGRTKT